LVAIPRRCCCCCCCSAAAVGAPRHVDRSSGEEEEEQTGDDRIVAATARIMMVVLLLRRRASRSAEEGRERERRIRMPGFDVDASNDGAFTRRVIDACRLFLSPDPLAGWGWLLSRTLRFCLSATL